MITPQEAIMSLRPGAEWTMNGNDVEGIVWHTKGVKPLTEAEVQDEIVRLEQLEVQYTSEPTVDDVAQAILIIAEGDDAVAKHISDKAVKIAQERAAQQ